MFHKTLNLNTKVFVAWYCIFRYLLNVSLNVESLLMHCIQKRYVTCAAHGHHKTSEEVRGQFCTVDKIVANVKKIFKKAPSRLQVFKTYTSGHSITTRASFHLLGHMDKCCFLLQQNSRKNLWNYEYVRSEEASSIKLAKKIMLKDL